MKGVIGFEGEAVLICTYFMILSGGGGGGGRIENQGL